MTDKQLIAATRQFRNGLLRSKGMFRPKSDHFGLCYMVSAPLQGFLSISGIETELLRYDVKIFGQKAETNHFCLKLPDGRILDATASQFHTPEGEQMPDIYLGAKPDWYTVKSQK